MNRTGLMIALAVAAVAGIVLGAIPALDLQISGLFFDSDTKMFRLGYLMAVGRSRLARHRARWPACG